MVGGFSERNDKIAVEMAKMAFDKIKSMPKHQSCSFDLKEIVKIESQVQ